MTTVLVFLSGCRAIGGCDSADDAEATPAREPKKKGAKRRRRRARSASATATASTLATALPTALPTAFPTAMAIPTATASAVVTTTVEPSGPHPGLLDPSRANMRAPATFQVRFETTKGPIHLTCHRSWAPHGADRFYSLVKIGFFRDVALFRVMRNFIVQWGIHGDPKVSEAWRRAELPVDKATQSNRRGTLAFAMASKPTTRTTQLFINLQDNARLDKRGHAPLCIVSDGMNVVEAFHAGYGSKLDVQQDAIRSGGNAYLRGAWPKLDYITAATVLGGP